MKELFPPDPSSSLAKAALRKIVDSAPMLVWQLDHELNCTYLNPSAAGHFAPGEPLNITSWLEFVHPDDVWQTALDLNAAYQARREYQVQYRMLRSDGSVRWMLGTGAPQFSEDGSFLGYQGSEVDVTAQHAALEVLARSEAAHRLITDNSSDLIAHHDASGDLVQVSPSVKRLLGFEIEEYRALNFKETVHQDDLQLLQTEILRQHKQGCQPETIEIRKRHKQGNFLWFACRLQVVAAPATQAIVGVISICRDIAAERQAREELKRREERFHGLTTLSSDWFWETDANGRFTFISDGISRSFGVGVEYFLSTNRAQFADEESPDIPHYLEALAARRPFKNLRYSTRSPATGKRLHLMISGEPVFCPAGSFAGYRGVGSDMTEEVHAAERLEALSEEHRRLVENSVDIIAMMDANGRIVRINSALTDVLGYAPEEWLGRHYGQFLVADDLQRAALVERGPLKAAHVMRDLETRWRRKDGSLAILSVSVRWSAEKNMVYATARDVTEARRTQLELARSKDRLSSILESIGDAFFSVDHNWVIRFVNEKTARLLKRGKEELLGRVLWTAVPELLSSPLLQNYQEAMQRRVAHTFEEYWELAQAWFEVRIYPQDKGIAVYFHDISIRREAEEAIRESEHRLREMIELTPAAYLRTDETGTLLEVNPALCHMTGHAKRDLLGKRLNMIFKSCPWEGRAFEDNGPSSAHGMEAVLSHRDGKEVHVLLNASVERDAHGRALAMTAFLTDITERRQVQASFEHLANHDALTGLPNRVALSRRTAELLDQAGRMQLQVAVLFIDLDRFKEVNDSFGHGPGDVLLQEVSRRLKSILRPTDLVARMGGDEFIVVAPCSAGRRSAQTIANKLFNALARPVVVAGQEIYVTASMGGSMFPEDGASCEVLLQNADTAMYEAKSMGRNCFHFFEQRMSQEAKLRVMLDTAMRQALARKEFELYLQPRIALRTRQVTGFEALIRWRHPELGLVNPGAFIPIAESNGLIEIIGAWVLQEACKQAKDLCERFGRTFSISVNVSPVQLRSPHIVQLVSSALRRSGLPPQSLELELTEATLVEDIDFAASVLSQLKHLGVRLSVDDFGTGYSSLAYLRRFPLDVVKLDRSFVTGSENREEAAFIKAFIDMAHALKLAVVAEGVETEDVLQLLLKADCDEAQGYIVARPMTALALHEYLCAAVD